MAHCTFPFLSFSISKLIFGPCDSTRQALEEDEDPEVLAEKKRASRERRAAREALGEMGASGSEDEDDASRKRKRTGAGSATPSTGADEYDEHGSVSPLYFSRFDETDDLGNGQKRQKVQLTPEQERMKVAFSQILDVLDSEDHVRFFILHFERRLILRFVIACSSSSTNGPLCRSSRSSAVSGLLRHYQKSDRSSFAHRTFVY